MDSINAHIAKFSAFLDANVVYKSHVRDLILRCAETDTFKVYWSPHIEQEVARALTDKVELARIQRLFAIMQQAFPDSVVIGYESFVESIALPDPKDRHVVAAAMRAHCDVIVTENVKDFPDEELAKYDLEAQHPDIFLLHHYTLEPQKTVRVIQLHIRDMNNPPVDFAGYIERLRTGGVGSFAEKLVDDKVEQLIGF